MKFGNCSDCGKYKFIGKKGICKTCSEESRVNIRLDILDESLRSPSTLRVIANTMNAVNGVQCDGTSDKDKRQDDLDLKKEYCRLYEAENKYQYSNYSGDRDEQVRKAIKDALYDAKRIYDD
jgi:hypothetical protein